MSSSIPLVLNGTCFNPSVATTVPGFFSDKPDALLVPGKTSFILQNVYFGTVSPACDSCTGIDKFGAGLWQTLDGKPGTIKTAAPAQSYTFVLSQDGTRLLLRINSPADPSKPFIAFQPGPASKPAGTMTPWLPCSQETVDSLGASWGLVKSSRGGTYLLYQNTKLPVTTHTEGISDNGLANPGVVTPCGVTLDGYARLIPAPRPPSSANALELGPCSASPGFGFTAFMYNPQTLVACDPQLNTRQIVLPPAAAGLIPVPPPASCSPSCALTAFASAPICPTCNCGYMPVTSTPPPGTAAPVPDTCTPATDLGMGVNQFNQLSWMLTTVPMLLPKPVKIGLYVVIGVCVLIIIIVAAVLGPRIAKSKRAAGASRAAMPTGGGVYRSRRGGYRATVTRRLAAPGWY